MEIGQKVHIIDGSIEYKGIVVEVTECYFRVCCKTEEMYIGIVWKVITWHWNDDIIVNEIDNI